MTHIDPQMQRVQERIADLTGSLNLAWSVDSEFVGEIDGYPAMLNVVLAVPLTLSFVFRIRTDRDAPVADVERLQAELREKFEVSGDLLRFSIDDGYAWLELFQVDGFDNESLRAIVADTTAKLTALGVALPGGCQRCGTTEGVRLLNVQHRPARTCDTCIQQAVAAAAEAEAQPTLPALPALAILGAALLGLAVAWAAVWVGGLELVRFFDIQVIDINKLSTLILLGLVLVAGVPLGMAIGTATRATELDRTVSPYVTILFVLCVAAVGEYCVALQWAYRFTGRIELVEAFVNLPTFIGSYTLLWMALKLATLVAAAVTSLNYTYVPSAKIDL